MKRFLLSISSLFLIQSSYAALLLEKTRIIINGGENAISLKVSNKNTQVPYLAKTWIEDTDGKTVSSPFFAVPPLQRLEPKQIGQISLKVLPEIKDLPQDRESIFYFNLREIPPNNNKTNILQLAIQNNLKIFYRPEKIKVSAQQILNDPWQEKLKLVKSGNQVIAKNPTPYFITILGVQQKKKGKVLEGFKSFMISPYQEKEILVDINWIGKQPIFTYIDDYGRKQSIEFKCEVIECNVVGKSFMAESM